MSVTLTPSNTIMSELVGESRISGGTKTSGYGEEAAQIGIGSAVQVEKSGMKKSELKYGKKETM